MDIDRRAMQRPAIREDFHPVDECTDPIRFVRDQSRQLAILDRHGLFQELRCTADPRQWILDLMREHRRHCGHRARGIAMDQLMIDLARDRSFMNGEDDGAGLVIERRRGDRGEARADARAVDGHAVFGHRGHAGAGLPDQREDRTIRRHVGFERGAAQHDAGIVEQHLGRGVHVDDAVRGIDDDDRRRQQAQDRRRLEGQRSRFKRITARDDHVHDYAAIAPTTGAHASRIAARIAAGSTRVMARARNSAAPGKPFAYQPICLRAMRTPVSRP